MADDRSTGPASDDDPMRETEAEATALEHARDILSSCYAGVLHIDGSDTSVPLKFIRDPADGRLIFACPVATFFAEELVLFTPEETDDAMKLLLSAEQIEESALTDRWQAYHGEPEHVRWGVAWIDSAKHGPWVFDGDALMQPAGLADCERAILKGLNADRGVLATMLERTHGLKAAEPVAVGVDRRGLDVRARFEPVRVAFASPAESEDEAHARIDDLLG